MGKLRLTIQETQNIIISWLQKIEIQKGVSWLLKLKDLQDPHRKYPTFLVKATEVHTDGETLSVTLHPEDDVVTSYEEYQRPEKPLQITTGRIATPESPLYLWAGGVVPIFKCQGEEYLVLVQRSQNASYYPGALSGFLGGAECLDDCLNFSHLISREFQEELLITKGDELYFVPDLKIDYLEADHKKIKDRFSRMRVKTLWGTFLNFKVRRPHQKVRIVWQGESKECPVYFFVDRETGRINLLQIRQINLNYSIEDFTFRDGEGGSTGNFLHRRILLFDLSEFLDWWKNQERDLRYTHSFQKGKSLGEGELEKPTLSPVFEATVPYLW